MRVGQGCGWVRGEGLLAVMRVWYASMPGVRVGEGGPGVRVGVSQGACPWLMPGMCCSIAGSSS